MGLFIDTVSADVSLPELGITLVHPATNYDLSSQFSPDDIRDATTLTSVITGGQLNWKKTSGGAVEANADYDPDFLDVEYEDTGTGEEDDQTATKLALVDVYEDNVLKLKNALILNFEDNLDVTVDGPTKKATIKSTGGGPGDGWALGFPLIHDNSKPFLAVSEAVYTEKADFIFPGTTQIGSSSFKIKAIAKSNEGVDQTKGIDIRVYDVTNSLVIAEVVDVFNNTKQIIDLGSVSNLPSGEAIFEFQGRKSLTSPKDGVFYSFIMYED